MADAIVYANKYNLILEALNVILENINGDKHVPITDITEFKSIDRQDFVSDINVGYMRSKEFIKKIIDVYGVENTVFHKTSAKNAPIFVIKYLAADIGFDMAQKPHEISIMVEGKKFRRTMPAYSIIKKKIA